MMHELQNLTISICILCTMAGLIRLFAPSGTFKAVINGALLLYILATGAKMARNADWEIFARQIYSWQQSENIVVPDYTDYADEIAADAAAAEICKTLQNEGIQASVSVSGNECVVRLETVGDMAAARVLLKSQSQMLQFRFEVEGNE